MTWAPPGRMAGDVARRSREQRPGLELCTAPISPGRPGATKTTSGGTMRGLDGRTYIVTGAASGIGRATAGRLLAEGSRVVGADLAHSPAESHERWLFTHVDVSDEA